MLVRVGSSCNMSDLWSLLGSTTSDVGPGSVHWVESDMRQLMKLTCLNKEPRWPLPAVQVCISQYLPCCSLLPRIALGFNKHLKLIIKNVPWYYIQGFLLVPPLKSLSVSPVSRFWYLELVHQIFRIYLEFQDMMRNLKKKKNLSSLEEYLQNFIVDQGDIFLSLDFDDVLLDFDLEHCLLPVCVCHCLRRDQHWNIEDEDGRQ